MNKSEIRKMVEKLSAVELKLLASRISDLKSKAAKDIHSENNRVVAYVIPTEDFDADKLKSYLKKNIPDYLIPSAIHLVPEIPKLPNGKIDRNSFIMSTKIPLNESSAIRPNTHLERQLVALWEEVLQTSPIKISDNFFELGGDSILSIQFIAKARKADILITPNQIFDYQTISELANFITRNKQQTEQWDYLAALRKNGSKKPLFCIHAGGGHVFFYNLLTKYMEDDRPIYALQAAGFYGNKEMHNSISEMARDYIAAIQTVQSEGPYNIMVYCFSVSVGHEMLIQLKKQGFETNLIVMDTITDPWRNNTPERFMMRIRGFVKQFLKEPIKTVKLRLGLRLLRIKILINKKVGTQEDQSLSRVNTNLAKICMAYQWIPHNDKVTLILTEKPDKKHNRMIINSWEKIALGGVNVVITKGDHITLFNEPDVAFVAKKLDENCL